MNGPVTGVVAGTSDKEGSAAPWRLAGGLTIAIAAGLLAVALPWWDALRVSLLCLGRP
jgi:hypothetical protein